MQNQDNSFLFRLLFTKFQTDKYFWKYLQKCMPVYAFYYQNVDKWPLTQIFRPRFFPPFSVCVIWLAERHRPRTMFGANQQALMLKYRFIEANPRRFQYTLNSKILKWLRYGARILSEKPSMRELNMLIIRPVAVLPTWNARISQR